MNHIAAKTLEKVCSTQSHHAKAFIAGDIGPMLWCLFTHSSVDPLRVTAISVSTVGVCGTGGRSRVTG